ncbi:MAG TPA: DsbA family oxidoreductase [Chryseosolibacter sp.]|nr:DsbA family oxidoreductase [Chryseosolibacter sp.]
MKPKIKIAVVSDVVCPWCYIGKRRLEEAVKEVEQDFEFEIAYYPFELNPDIPKEGINQRDYLTKKFGGQEQYRVTTANVSKVAATEGLAFDFEKQLVSPNTRDAHRLILFANQEGKQARVVEGLFKAYFTDGVDLTKIENLLSIAELSGLDRGRTELFLNSSTGNAEVAAAEKELSQMGISGVPFYIINDQYGISGAQPKETFIRAFQNIATAKASQGEACDVDGSNC